MILWLHCWNSYFFIFLSFYVCRSSCGFLMQTFHIEILLQKPTLCFYIRFSFENTFTIKSGQVILLRTCFSYLTNHFHFIFFTFQTKIIWLRVRRQNNFVLEPKNVICKTFFFIKTKQSDLKSFWSKLSLYITDWKNHAAVLKVQRVLEDVLKKLKFPGPEKLFLVFEKFLGRWSPLEKFHAGYSFKYYIIIWSTKFLTL